MRRCKWFGHRWRRLYSDDSGLILDVCRRCGLTA